MTGPEISMAVSAGMRRGFAGCSGLRGAVKYTKTLIQDADEQYEAKGCFHPFLQSIWLLLETFFDIKKIAYEIENAFSFLHDAFLVRRDVRAGQEDHGEGHG
jgi:hypothetical protein